MLYQDGIEEYCMMYSFRNRDIPKKEGDFIVYGWTGIQRYRISGVVFESNDRIRMLG